MNTLSRWARCRTTPPMTAATASPPVSQRLSSIRDSWQNGDLLGRPSFALSVAVHPLGQQEETVAAAAS